MKTGDILKELREGKGLTQLDLCSIINVEQSTLANYENNRRVPKIEILLAIADYFNVTTDYLLGASDSPQKAAATIISEIDKGFFRVTEEAKQRGFDPDDLMMAMDFLERARKRDNI